MKLTESIVGKSSMKFLRTYIDRHGIPESIRTDQLSGFKGKAMKKFCFENNTEQKFGTVGDHRECGLVEQTIQTVKRRLEIMLLDENVASIKLCPCTIIRDGQNKKPYNALCLMLTLDAFQKQRLKY